jgi:hypothetical protein
MRKGEEGGTEMSLQIADDTGGWDEGAIMGSGEAILGKGGRKGGGGSRE